MRQGRISAGKVIRELAEESERSGQRARRVAARHLHQLADRLERAEVRARDRQARRTAKVRGEPEPVTRPDSRYAERDTDLAQTWVATGRSADMVTLRRAK